jgi:glutamine amidotransferase
MIIIVDYGVGNLASIRNMFKKIGAEAEISSDESVIRGAEKLILPGVGAFDTCAEKLAQSGLIPALNEMVLTQKTPVLGVCVGMQLLFEGSEEGILPGLGWIAGRVVKFRPEQLPPDLKIPHMGWTDVRLKKSSRLFEPMHEEPRFYFVHSYYASVTRAEDILLEADYGIRFTAAVERENIMGVQFHPEKSHKFGMQLLANFAINS